MASVHITYTWAKHASLLIEILTEDSYPDAIDQAVSEAGRALIDSLIGITAAEHQTDDTPNT